MAAASSDQWRWGDATRVGVVAPAMEGSGFSDWLDKCGRNIGRPEHGVSYEAIMIFVHHLR